MAINGEKVLAVVPARAGSKRCPGKNLRDVRGIPLLAWTFGAAWDSQYIDTSVLSTDSEEIIKKVSKYKRLEIIMRPARLATDTASNEDVMRHALTVYPDFDWVILLQPTSPLREAEDIDRCLELAQPDNGCVSYRDDTGGKNGAVYCCRVAWLQRGHDFGIPFRKFYMMPAERSLDIDWPEEFEL